ncbi:hypothetical protein C1T17_16360 [Sphingobium sp. SCG-1]|uniref:hypothetical protein n=1 Tax=Sphingobium sp. SCG-1 TaxID=2072936 RepID=UPI000CD6AFD5|nr:hypothetical protein [Sphingobium sp. SCG-1]AUW59426.1 hypothetical protein C1T17_16360 [Sphingobium sp. SCG-1]
MLLDAMEQSTGWQRVSAATAPMSTPNFTRPILQPLDDSPDTLLISPDQRIGRPITESQEVDGIRILDAIAPLERAKYFTHNVASRLEVLQAWEGAVIDVRRNEGTFTAQLYDLNNPGEAISEAEFDIQDVSSNDIGLLKEGSIFRWMIGYRMHSFGQRERVSAIVFRRLPNWSAEDIKAAVAEGGRIAEELVVL